MIISLPPFLDQSIFQEKLKMSRTTNINLLPQEMITEIFTRLPSKSLGLCKCVSKSWDSFISDPCFVKTHLAKTCITKLILIAHKPRWGTLFSLNYNNHPNLVGVASNLRFKTSQYFDNYWSKVWGSCNGLLLLENHREIRFLLNPTTLKFKRLHPQYRGYVEVFGFGYDFSSDDYVVVGMPCNPSVKGDTTLVCVYKLKENTWKSVEFSTYDHALIRPVPGLFFGGCLHWLAKDVNDASLLIAAFDIAKMEFSRVTLPNAIFDCNSENLSIQVLKGCLCLVTVCNSKTELWVMKEYGVAESWIKLPVDLTEGSCLVSTQLAEDSLVVMNGGQFVLLVSNEKEVMIQPMNVLGLPSQFITGMTYVDSLVSPITKDWKIKNTRRGSKKKQRLE